MNVASPPRTPASGGERQHSSRRAMTPALRIPPSAPALLLTVVGLASPVLNLRAQPVPQAITVRAGFENRLINSQSNPPTSGSSSAYIQDGHQGPYAVPGAIDAPRVPAAAGGGPRLIESAFGQMLAADVPQPRFVEDSIRLAQADLYPAPGLTREQIEASGAVFRYQPLLYGRAPGGGVAADYGSIAQWYGDPERQRFTQALQHLRDALKYAPLDRRLHHAVLDAFYDRHVAEAQFLKQDASRRAEYRLGFRLPAADEFIIDKEIGATEELMARHRQAIEGYCELLTDRMGVDLGALGVGAPAGMPLGTYLLQQAQPDRNQLAARFLDSDGILKTVPNYDPGSGEAPASQEQRVLFAGYKDHLALLGILRDYTTQAAELARLYGMRGRRTAQQDDRLRAYALVREVQTEVALSGTLLRGLFPDHSPEAGDASGIRAAVNGIETALGELDNVRAFLDGQSNALGFSPDFLVLIQEFPDSTQGNQFDSFDAIIRWIRNTATSPINFAKSTFDLAVSSYSLYRGYADQVFTQLDQLEDTYAERYFEITGFDPGDSTADPLVHPKAGSELWQAQEDLALARQRVNAMRSRTVAIQEAITTANQAVLDATGRQQGITDALNVYVGTANSAWDQAALWSQITAGSQAAYDTISDMAGVDGVSTIASAGGTVAVIGVSGAINAALQVAGAGAQAEAERQLDLASATFDAALAAIDSQLVIHQAVGELQALLREQISIALESADAQAVLRQENARRDGLIRELERLQQGMEEDVANLHDRYYADPVHQLRAQNGMVLADQAFREAQRWIFFSVRALEFKWNRDFAIRWVGKDWDRASLFKLRNFTELEQFVGALEEFNRINLIGFNREPFVDVISLQRDVYAPYAGSGPDDGLRFDTETRELIPATELFRRRLARTRDPGGNLVIRLNTFALRPDGGFLFLGPRYHADGSVLTAGKYLDKIEWIKFNLVGNFAPAVRDAALTYGGTCYIRNRVPPCLDPGESTRLRGEYRVFPFLYFYTLDNGVTWLTRKTQADTVKLVYSNASGEPDRGVAGSTLENRFLKERSVAATDWVLTIPAANLDLASLDDLEIYVRHVFVSRDIPDCN